MPRLFAFLVKLMADERYCDVVIRFRKGKVSGQIEIHEQYLEETLPQPDTSDPRYQKVLADTISGVS